MTDLSFKEEVFKIIRAAMEVYEILGTGFLEAVYQEALAIELRLRGIPYLEQPHLCMEFEGHLLKWYYVPDFFCYEK